MSEAILCYEVWTMIDTGEDILVGAYWSVQDAWRVMRALSKVKGNENPRVLVANGLEKHVERGTEPRTDVIGEGEETRMYLNPDC